MGFDSKEILRVVVRVCRDISNALDSVADVQNELLEAGSGVAEWGNQKWDRIIIALDSAKEWLRSAAEELADLKQQLEELKEEYNRRALARHGTR